jgi:hypothetical protein
MNIKFFLDILSSSICIQTGSFSVEQKEIDSKKNELSFICHEFLFLDSILAKQIVREQQRMYKNASKSRKTSGKLRNFSLIIIFYISSGYQSPSSTVGPIDVLSSM